MLGDHGGLKVGYERHTPITRYDKAGAHHDYVPYFPERFAQAYAAELQGFVEAVRGGKPVSPTGHDGLMALRIALAATESAHATAAPGLRCDSARAVRRPGAAPAPGATRETRQPDARRRATSSVAASAGKNDSIRSSCSVMSCGVPRLVSIEK